MHMHQPAKSSLGPAANLFTAAAEWRVYIVLYGSVTDTKQRYVTYWQACGRHVNFGPGFRLQRLVLRFR